MLLLLAKGKRALNLTKPISAASMASKHQVQDLPDLLDRFQAEGRAVPEGPLF